MKSLVSPLVLLFYSQVQSVSKIKTLITDSVEYEESVQIEAKMEKNADDNFVLKPLVWSENREANNECCYNHCIAETPFGRFLLTWKGWKERPTDGMGFDETPWDDVWYDGWDSVEDAQKEAEEMLLNKIKKMVL